MNFIICKYRINNETTLAQRLPADLKENIVRFHRFVIAARRHVNYPLTGIYNMDETPICFELPSNQTLEFSGSRKVPVKSCGMEKQSFLPSFLLLLLMVQKCHRKSSSKASVHEETWLCHILFVFPSIRKGGWMNRAYENGFDRVCHELSAPFWCGTHSELT